MRASAVRCASRHRAVDAELDQLGVAADRVERRAQLVAHHRQELALGTVGRLCPLTRALRRCEQRELVQRRERAVGSQRGARRPADHPARTQVEQHGEEQPALAGRQVRLVADPRAVRGRVRVQAEAPRQQVGRDGLRVGRVGGAHGAPPPTAHEAVLAHESRDPLPRHAPAGGAQFALDPRRAVAPAALAEGGSDLDAQPSSAAARRAGGPAARRRAWLYPLTLTPSASHMSRTGYCPW
jgi:hypothetical protein